jgi:uncharacterized protein (UPF0147 family)
MDRIVVMKLVENNIVYVAIGHCVTEQQFTKMKMKHEIIWCYDTEDTTNHKFAKALSIADGISKAFDIPFYGRTYTYKKG